MVSTSMIVFLILGGLICFVLPLITFLYFKKKSPKLSGPLIAGILSFYIFQMVIRLPLLQGVLPIYEWYSSTPILVSALFLGGTAALMETLGRFLTMKFVLRDRQSYYSGIAHGIGHGGVEAILLLGINYLAYAVFAYMINNGGYEALMIDQSDMIIAQYTYLQDFLTANNIVPIIIAIFERIFVFIIQIGLSLLVMEAIVFKKYKYIFLAFFVHMALDTASVVLVSSGVNIYLIELYVAFFAGISLWYIITSKKRFKNNLIAEESTEKYLKSDY